MLIAQTLGLCLVLRAAAAAKCHGSRRYRPHQQAVVALVDILELAMRMTVAVVEYLTGTHPDAASLVHALGQW